MAGEGREKVGSPNSGIFIIGRGFRVETCSSQTAIPISSNNGVGIFLLSTFVDFGKGVGGSGGWAERPAGV